MPENKDKAGVQTNAKQGEVINPPKKRGRPKKEITTTPVANEEKTKIIMNDNNFNNNLNNIADSFRDFERISMDRIQQRWGQIFSKYSNIITSTDISALIARTSNYTRNDPFLNNARVKSIIAQGKKLAPNEVDDYVENPVSNERNLQEVSWALYYQSMVYMYLTRIDRETPCFNYFVIPENLEPTEYKKDSYKKEKKKIDSIMRVLKPKITFKDMIIQMQNEGKIFMIPRISFDDKEADFFTWQKLPNEFCKIVGFGSTERFVIMLDMSMFLNPMYDTEQYPPFIREKWEEMLTNGVIKKTKKGTYSIEKKIIDSNFDIIELSDDIWHYWYRLPQDQVFVFSMDGSHPLVIPDSSGILPDISDLSQYKLAQQTALSKAITSILTGEVPYADNLVSGKDQTALSPDTIIGFTDLFEQRVGSTVLPFFAPFKNYELHSLSDDIEPATTIVNKRIQDVVNTSGLSGIVNLSDRPSIATVKTAQLIAEAKAKYLVAQFENAVNRIINENFELKYEWKVHFWGYAFTLENEMKLMKELILSGCKELLPRFLSGYNMTLEEYASSHNMIEALGIEIIKDELRFSLEEARKTQIESQKANSVQLGDTTKNNVGRPPIDDNDVENDNTSDSKLAGTDVSDTKSIYEKLSTKIVEDNPTIKDFINEFVSTDSEDEVLEVLSEELEDLK